MISSTHTTAVRVLLCLYASEAALLLILVGIYKANTFDIGLLTTKAGLTIGVGSLGLLGSSIALANQLRAEGGDRLRAVAISLTVNLGSWLSAFLIAETLLSTIATKTEGGIVVGSLTLEPTWADLRGRSQRVLDDIAPKGNWDSAFFSYDPELGWTVGPNRKSADGLYFSSAEGIRSAGPNMRFAHSKATYRVALIGDSNAFSLEVPFKESLGHHLQALLGDDIQVLNFGVNGYGIDQMYLRYMRDVRPWKPHVVIVGFVGHNFVRTLAVYPLISFGWFGYVVKPRFVLNGGDLRLLNLPLPRPADLVTTTQIDRLPFIDYDFGYGTTDWRWRFDHAPLIQRYFMSAFPRWVVPNPKVSENVEVELNSTLLIKLVQSIESAGAVPLPIFLSQAKDGAEREILHRIPAGVLVGVDCLGQIPDDRRKVPSGYHYTDAANLAIAQCAAPTIRRALKPN